MMGLAQAMFAVQEQIPALLSGKPLHTPSTLVHEMFAKYSNGTKTEADLAAIDKGLDELFFHDFSAEDNERLADFVGAGDLFESETVQLPQVVPNKTIPLVTPPPQLVAAFPNVTVTQGRVKSVAYQTSKTANFSIPGPALANVSFADRFFNSTQVKWAQLGSNISSFQSKVDAGAAKRVQAPDPTITAAFRAALPSAKSLGAAYKKQQPSVPAIPTDPLPGLTAAGSTFWNAVNNNSLALQVSGRVAEHGDPLPSPDIKSVNVYGRWQNNTLLADQYLLNLTRTAFPANTGFDWLRPAVDVATAVPVADALAPAASFLQFRDPVLGQIAKTSTVTSAFGTSGAKTVFDPSANLAQTRAGKFNPANVYSMSKINLLEASFNQIQWRPCIARVGATGADASPDLIRIRPELIGVSIVGSRADPQLIDIGPHLIKVQAVGAQWNPEFVNVEPILVQVSPKVNVAGRAVAKWWQKDQPGAPARSRKFIPSKEKDKRLTLAPYAGPHTTG